VKQVQPALQDKPVQQVLMDQPAKPDKLDPQVIRVL